MLIIMIIFLMKNLLEVCLIEVINSFVLNFDIILSIRKEWLDYFSFLLI